MDYAVLLYFDKETDGRLQALIEKLAAAGVNNSYREMEMRPHLTLAVINTEDGEMLTEFIAARASSLQPLKVRLASIGFFPDEAGVLYLAPVVNQELLQIHKQINDQLEQLSGSFSSLYREKNWVPHCTLALELKSSDIRMAYEILLQEFKPVDAIAGEIGLISCCPYSEKMTMPLGKADKPV